ncbi:hypothetical protein AOLI_G00034960 [Acnodon oligacanthus]
MPSSTMQMLAFILALLGVLGATVATLLPNWKTARTTMVLSCMMATLGLCLAALGLKCTHWGGSHRSKGHTALAAGACFVIAGVLCLVPASWFTNEVITTFMDSKVPKSSKNRNGPLDSGSSHPDKLLRQVVNDRHKQKQHREQQSQTEPQEQQHKEKTTHQEKLQVDEMQPDQPKPEKSQLEQEQQYYSPSRNRLQDAKAVYSLQDYV